MSKKTILIINMVLVLILSIMAGFIVYEFLIKDSKIQEREKIAEKITDDCTNEEMLNFDGEDVAEVSSTQDKLSPNADFFIKKKYKQCGHIVKTNAELPKEMVNMTQEEIEKQYTNMKVESFLVDEIIFIKEEEGICNEHYILKEKDGKIVVYKLDNNQNEQFVEETGITTEYLPQTDVINIKSGIKVYGKEKLNSALEDFE